MSRDWLYGLVTGIEKRSNAKGDEVCGIVGIIDKGIPHHKLKELLLRMNNLIEHRGPDDSGYWIEGPVGLAMRRLAVIDLSETGRQPMRLEGANLTIVFNGEVYNYKEIAEELKNKGHSFKGSSDTEVILHAYQEWGIECFKKFNGMFAIGLWDGKKKALLLARDRVGVKPLFYWNGLNGEVVFGSEFKAVVPHPSVKREVNPKALFHYLIYNTTATPDTLLYQIKQVEPGTILTFIGGRIYKEIFWAMPSLKPDAGLTEKKVIDDVESLLHDSIKLRLRSDVPVGIFLSGGIDSTLIAAIAKGINPDLETFSIGYRGYGEDETGYAEETARFLGTKHHSFNFGASQLDFEKLITASDDPLGNMTMVPYLFLARMTRKHVKVVLSGDGGDEFFCGYSSFLLAIKILRIKRLVPHLLWKAGARCGSSIFRKGKLNRNFRVVDFKGLDELLAKFQIMMPIAEVAALIRTDDELHLPEKYTTDDGSSFLNLNYSAARTYLTDTVLKTSDRATMASSLEGRMPFVDYRLIEYSSRIPEEIQFKNGISKYVLKKILGRHMPKEMFDRPKKGFSLPMRVWLKGPLKYLIDNYLSGDAVRRSVYLNAGPVSNLVSKYNSGVPGYENILWHLIILQLWFDRYGTEA